jgi:hypothetical protein
MRRLFALLPLLALLVFGHAIGHTSVAYAQAGVARSPPPAAFSPTSISGLVLWMRPDAANIPGAANGSKFSAWNALAGPAFSQATSGDQFVWNSSDTNFGGMPTVTTANGENMTSNSAIALSQPYTGYWVFKENSASAENVLSGSGGISSNFQADVSYFLQGGANINGGTTTTSPTVACGVLSGSTTSAIYINNSQTAVVTGSTGTGALSGTYYLGYPALTLTLAGQYAEHLLFSGMHTAAQRAQMFAYFGRRYGLAVSANDNGTPDWRLALLDLPRAGARQLLVGWPFPANDTQREAAAE